MRTWIIVLLAAGSLGLAGIYSLSGGGQPVEASPARRGEIREFIDERGQTRLPQTHSITMPYAGRITAIPLVEGTPVKAGEVVARIVPLDLSLSVDAAEASVARLAASIRENDDVSVEKTTLKQTESLVDSINRTVEAAKTRVEAGQAKKDYSDRSLERIRKLRSSAAKSEDEFEQAQLAQVQASVDLQQDVLVLRAMQAIQAATTLMPIGVTQDIDRKLSLTRDVLARQEAEAQVKLRQVKNDQQRGTMTSPVDGVVLQRLVSDEQQLAAGAELLRIGRLEDLEVEADILSQEVVNVREGNEAEISGPAIGKTAIHGHVRRIYPAGFSKISSLGVEQQRVKVVLAFAPDELARVRQEHELGVAYRVHVRIFTDLRSQATVVPRSARFRSAAGGWQLFVVRGGKAALQDVEVGLMNDDAVEIRRGLQEGETVVLAPETNLTEGKARVKPLVRQSRPSEAAAGD